ncbi:MAG: Fe-S cluster assembly protein SufD [Chloroflexi bacterium]|nr:Fe-S cluster assembly protein SufD [Chloroflexota bacterium]
MTQQSLTQEARYLSAFESFEKNGATRDPSWARALRQAAIARFRELGFPVARRGNEEWKYTDVGPIARAPLLPLMAAAPARVTARRLARYTFGRQAADWNLLVFVDGRYVEQLSSLPSLPTGASVTDLADALANGTGLAEQHLARYADYNKSAFTALNTAFLHDGALVHIPDGVQVDAPIHLLFLYTSRAQDAASHPRVLVIAGKESKTTIIESHGGLEDNQYFANAVTEVALGERAAVRYYKVQRQSEQSFHIATTQVELGRDSTFLSCNLDLGGGLVRNNLNMVLAGEGSSCMLGGLYMVSRNQHVDNQVIVDHAASYTTTRELYKGILDGKSRSVFHGSIIVRKGLHKVNAEQVDKNLLLSDRAEADTKPAFWIYSDDVKCGHGAACGQLDERALFYLRSRGLSEEEARGFLVRGFVAEVVNAIDYAPFRGHAEELVAARLQAM